MQFSNNCINLVAKFEGFIPTPYKDPGSGGKPYTIGMGTTVYPNGKEVTLQDSRITKDQAKEYLLDHLNKNVLPGLSKLIKVSLTQNQIDSLGSLCYNIGIGNFSKSTLLKKINEKASFEDIKTQFLSWDKANHKTLKGLTLRRIEEYKLYTT